MIEVVDRSVLLRDDDGMSAFWVTTYADGRITVSDCNTETPLGENGTVEQALADWKRCVGWKEKASGDEATE